MQVSGWQCGLGVLPSPYVVLCARGMCSTLVLLLKALILLQVLQKWQPGFQASLSFVQNLPQLLTHTIVFIFIFNHI